MLRYNAVLKNRSQYEECQEVLHRRGLPIHVDPAKNWDSLACLNILENEKPVKENKVLDAGGEYYSSFLPQLAMLGFIDLTCINILFEKTERRGHVLYQRGDITHTAFADEYFDFIACLSVIEHGVNIERYFCEMSRILQNGGLLFTSTDYWQDPLEVQGKMAYGVPIKIFSRDDIVRFIDIARSFGLRLVGTLDLECEELAVNWKEFDLNYTFIYFLLRKQ
jgi:SAM-dependent methyltransferase